jgi:tetratricopeptide (TPR) repeat protein
MAYLPSMESGESNTHDTPLHPFTPSPTFNFSSSPPHPTPADLVNAGKLDEAENAARDLLERFPEVHDGYDRLAMVYEARGDKKQAAYYYRKVIEVIRAHAEDYDSEFEAVFHKLVAELDPTTPPSDR